jgi:PhnB protein
MAVKAIPDGYHAVTPYLIVRGAARALEFYKRAFGAVELVRMDGPDGKLGHAEIRIGDSHVMLADEFPEMGARSPHAYGGSAVNLLVYVEDVDATFRQAIAAGGTEVRPLRDQFYGDRSGTVSDPYGHVWIIATHKEDMPPEELRRRSEAELQRMAAQ